MSMSSPTWACDFSVRLMNYWNKGKDNDVDLIVVGSHGEHGLALLVGSTTSGVLHEAACDVLSVRAKP